MKKKKLILEDLNLTQEQYVSLKKQQFREKQMRQTLKNNNKSNLGFGYSKQELTYEN